MQNKHVKKIPERRCVGCGETKQKAELIRIVRLPDMTVTVDFNKKSSGRGVYICNDSKCLKKALKSGRITSNLSVDIPDEVVSTLEELISRGENAEN